MCQPVNEEKLEVELICRVQLAPLKQFRILRYENRSLSNDVNGFCPEELLLVPSSVDTGSVINLVCCEQLEGGPQLKGVFHQEKL